MRTTTFARYGELLAQPPIRRLVLVGMLARVPHAAAGVLLTLHVVDALARGYTAAGIVATAITVGLAVGAPWRGHRVDTVGLRRALLPSVVAEAVIWSIAPFLPYELLIPAAVLGGLFALPVFSVVRQSLAVLVAEEQRRTAYAVDSMATELVFIVGPATGVVLATTLHTQIGLVLVGVCSALAGVLLMWFNPPTRSSQLGARHDAAESERNRRQDAEAVQTIAPAEVASATDAITSSLPLVTSAQRVVGRRARLGWMTPAVVAVLGAAAAVGLLLSGSDVSFVAVLRETDQVDSLGVVFAFWCLASVVGGLIYGVLDRPIPPMLLLAGMSLLTIPMALASDPLTLGLLAIPPGLLCAPTLTACSERVADLVGEARRGQAMGWYGSALTAGSALGSPMIGIAIDVFGPGAGFVGAGGVALVLALLGLGLVSARARTRRPS
ncbi:MFS transporter [Tersicoccus solisilvae]|uniref:MFS transporter n=1 Tax=Tersicoccus solisilvae TaxID=1882339 RepID=A0ABQ1PE98_9MICC|nr:MFS transporter [Tersicoccus solisilvae]GGC95513.1 MFS transporter [Tersicoccus solisilvae]